MTSGWQKGHRASGERPGGGLKTGDFVKEQLGELP